MHARMHAMTIRESCPKGTLRRVINMPIPFRTMRHGRTRVMCSKVVNSHTRTYQNLQEMLPSTRNSNLYPAENCVGGKA